MDTNSDFKLQLFGSVSKENFPALSAALKLAKVELDRVHAQECSNSLPLAALERDFEQLSEFVFREFDPECRETLLDLIVNGAGSFLTLKEDDLHALERCLIKVMVELGISFTLFWGPSATRVPGIMTFSAQTGKHAMVAGLADQPEVLQMPNAYQEPVALAA